MSPGATFERVYLELRRKLGEGAWPPGTPLEPAILGEDLAASITPVRDALHRLTGERLVEAPNHNGFRVPLLTEAGLRDLYRWNGQLLALALKTGRGKLSGMPMPAAQSGADVVAATATLFAGIAHATGSSEQVRAIDQLNARLGVFRRAEAEALPGVVEEQAQLAARCAGGGHVQLGRLVGRYHTRRMKAVPLILTASAVDRNHS